MSIKTPMEIKVMAEGGKILAHILVVLSQLVKPGITPLELDKKAEKMILDFGAKPSFKGYRGYKYTSCISINEEVVHGVPDTTMVKNGDLVSLDLGVYYRGWHTDSAITIGVGQISPQARKILAVTKNALYQAIKMIKPGVRLASIQQKIQTIVEQHSFSVIRDLAGHGIGRNLQEYPSIPNYLKKNDINDIILQPGMTFCLEPMVAIGGYKVKINDDGWTVQTLDGSLSAHFEHTLAVSKNGCQILTKE